MCKSEGGLYVNDKFFYHLPDPCLDQMSFEEIDWSDIEGSSLVYAR